MGVRHNSKGMLHSTVEGGRRRARPVGLIGRNNIKECTGQSCRRYCALQTTEANGQPSA